MLAAEYSITPLPVPLLCSALPGQGQGQGRPLSAATQRPFRCTQHGGLGQRSAIRVRGPVVRLTTSPHSPIHPPTVSFLCADAVPPAKASPRARLVTVPVLPVAMRPSRRQGTLCPLARGRSGSLLHRASRNALLQTPHPVPFLPATL